MLMCKDKLLNDYLSHCDEIKILYSSIYRCKVASLLVNQYKCTCYIKAVACSDSPYDFIQYNKNKKQDKLIAKQLLLHGDNKLLNTC